MIFALLLTICLMFTMVGCGNDESSKKDENQKTGTFLIELYPDYAPKTVANFEKLVKAKFYDGLTFHRVIDGFMAQGGDPNGDGTGGTSDLIEGEFAENSYTKNTISHTRGVVSMARGSSDYNSASSQFFICYTDDNAGVLDGKYAAFGKVDDEGMSVIDDFLNVKRQANQRGENAMPIKPITIKSAKMVGDSQSGNPRVEVTVTYTPEETSPSSKS